jgi:hypothetical protein
MSTRKRGPVGYTFTCAGLEEAFLLREKVQRYEAALAAIVGTEYSIWGTHLSALEECQHIARLALATEKDAERAGSDTSPEDDPAWQAGYSAHHAEHCVDEERVETMIAIKDGVEGVWKWFPNE